MHLALHIAERTLADELMSNSSIEESLRESAAPRDRRFRESLLLQVALKVAGIAKGDIRKPLLRAEELNKVSLSVPIEDFRLGHVFDFHLRDVRRQEGIECCRLAFRNESDRHKLVGEFPIYLSEPTG